MVEGEMIVVVEQVKVSSGERSGGKGEDYGGRGGGGDVSGSCGRGGSRGSIDSKC